jgi:hypothetical protein
MASQYMFLTHIAALGGLNASVGIDFWEIYAAILKFRPDYGDNCFVSNALLNNELDDSTYRSRGNIS